MICFKVREQEIFLEIISIPSGNGNFDEKSIR